MKRIAAVGALLVLVVVAAAWVLWPRNHQGLVLYSAVDYGPDVAAAFTRATGIHMRVVQLSTGALLARISAEGRRPAWTLAWFDGDQAAAALDRSGLLAPHTLPALPWTRLGRSLLPADGSYTPTGLTLAAAFTYRPVDFARPPQSWRALTYPTLRGAVGMNNPAISGPMYPLLAGLLQQGGGWPHGQAFVMALKRNGLHVYAKNANTLQALRTGDIKIAITQSSAAWYLAAKDPSLHVSIPSPSFALPSVLAIAGSAPPASVSVAERFVRFAMTPEIQQLRMREGESDGYYWPVTRGVTAGAQLPRLDSLAVVVLDPNRWGALEPTVNEWFSKAVVGQ